MPHAHEVPVKVVVIGGGAAGFFAAIAARRADPMAEVLLLEKSDKLLAKVRISGGGRCNVTHACFNNRELAAHYPRGGRSLRKVFGQWSVQDTVAWFQDAGVELKTEADGRMFPVTDRSATITTALIDAAARSGVRVVQRCGVTAIAADASGFTLRLSTDDDLQVHRVIVCSGGSPRKEGLAWLEHLGQPVVAPVPSLFTFNLERPLTHLMGSVAPAAEVWIEGTDLRAAGALLITHWGFSGPAVLRLSAWGARELAEMGYRYVVRVNWCGCPENELRDRLVHDGSIAPRRQIGNAAVAGIPQRLWSYLLERARVDPRAIVGEVGRNDRNRLINVLVNDAYPAKGKTTFKDEFVTAGGVALDHVDPNTMESRTVPGLFFAGEVLDIDGITGGFNFQAAWSTGWVAGTSAVRRG